MARKLTRDDIIDRFRLVHGDKYDYSKFEYINAITKGIIICPKHGEFLQSSNEHERVLIVLNVQKNKVKDVALR